MLERELALVHVKAERDSKELENYKKGKQSETVNRQVAGEIELNNAARTK